MDASGNAHISYLNINDGLKYAAWNGTTWKAMYRLRFSKPDLAVCTLNTDQGLGIVMKGKQDCVEFKNKFFEYRVFEKNLVEDLNLIKDWGVFIKWLEKNNLKLNSKH